MVSLDQLRRLALSLPEATAADHHGLDSFQVRGKIFATVPDEHHVRVMVNQEAILAAVAAFPGVCEPFFWGKRLACVAVDLNLADPDLVEELIGEAWQRCRRSRNSPGARGFRSRNSPPLALT
jgi:hypothetical protein